MTAEEMEKMADEYADIYVEKFQNIARRAYQDGIMEAFRGTEWMDMEDD